GVILGLSKLTLPGKLLEVGVGAREPAGRLAVVEGRMNPPGPQIDVVQERAEPDEQAGSLAVVPDQPERAGSVRVLVERLEPAQGLGVQRRDPLRAPATLLQDRETERLEEPPAHLRLVQAQRDAVSAPVLNRQPL